MTQQISKAFDLWIELTGIDPNSKSWSSKEQDVHLANRELKESLALDKTMATTTMMLQYYVEEFLSNRNFSAQEILEDYHTFQTYISKSKELVDILKSDDAQEIQKDLQENLKVALAHYGVEREDVFQVLDNPQQLAFLKRDALRSLNELSIHQFSHGETDKNQNAKYFKRVYQFWNVNSLIRAISKSEKSGVSLCLIRDTDTIHSYFAFAIRNGGTVSLLTDKPQLSHPLQQSMDRKPGRTLGKRISKHHFPYSLMDVVFNNNGDAFIFDEDTMVPYQHRAFPMEEIKNLPPEEVIWTIMMFGLIEKKFWKEEYRTRELSYTAEMMSLESPKDDLISALSLRDYKPISAPLLRSKDITSSKTKDDWENEQTGQHDWIEKRYESQIHDELLNLMDTSDKAYMLPAGETDPSALKRGTLKDIDIFNQDKIVRMQAVNPQQFGTKNQLLSDQRWYARYNKSKLLQVHALKEFNERKLEVFQWYEKAINENVETLMRSIAEGEFIAPSQQFSTGFENLPYERENIFKIYQKGTGPAYEWSLGGVSFLKEDNDDLPKCYITGSPYSIVAKFKPTTAEGLANLCGLEVNELPDVLQHWTKNEKYSGNHLTTKIDPLEWVIKNPWQKFTPNVTVYLSKRGYNQLRKEHGLEPNKFWLKKQD